ncbi:MAG: tetratricopeptide repeat protein [Calothrix sp. MO_192.B10]|nr:tetratricopeptide repeat protein [Calothrix sp. MO_192.B10]
MQVLRCLTNQEIIPLNLSVSLGRGGEACVYTVPTDSDLVAKVYHKPTKQHARKLQAMLAHPPENPMASLGHISIAWPCEVLRSADGKQEIIGFLMPRIRGMRPAIDFYNPLTRRQHCPLFNYQYLIRAARNLAAAFAALHNSGYCVGDVNESNILVSDTALVTLVDTDSFQVKDPNRDIIFRCEVGKPEFTPPELQNKTFAQHDRAIVHDLFGLGVLLFQMLMEGTHPFAGIFENEGEPPPYEARIIAGHFTYSQKHTVPYKPSPIAPAWEILHPCLQELFVRCFEDGHSNPLLRPSAQTWLSALNQVENSLSSCSVNPQHRYSNHLHKCPWCERTLRLGGRDPFPSLQAVAKKEHLKPRVKAKKKYPQRQRSPETVLPTHRVNYRPSVLPYQFPYYNKKVRTNPKIYPVILCLLGFGFLGYLDFMVKLTNRPFVQATNYTQQNWINRKKDKNLSFNDYYRQGHAFYKIRKYDLAIDKFSQAIKKNPTHPKTYIDRANASFNLKNYEAAIADYNRAIKINPNEFKAYVNRGNVRQILAEYSKDPNAEYKQAIADYNRALQINPQEIEAYIRRGIVRFQLAKYHGDYQPDFQKSLADFNQAIQISPSRAEAYFQRGLVRYQIAQYSSNFQQEYQRAIDDFNQALQLDDRMAKGYLKRGIVKYELGQYSDKNPKEQKNQAIADLQISARISLEKKDMESYQKALSNICLITETQCGDISTVNESLRIGLPEIK